MKRYVKFWSRITAEYLIYEIFAAAVFVICTFIGGNIDFVSSKTDICLSVFAVLYMFATAIARKKYAIQLSVAFGATRKKTAVSYICSEICLILINCILIIILMSNDMKGRGIILIAWLLLGAATGQLIEEADTTCKKIAVMVLALGVTIGIIAANLYLIFMKNDDRFIIPVVIFAFVYYAAATVVTIISTRKLEVRI